MFSVFSTSVSLLQKRAQRRGRKSQPATAQWVAAIFVWQNMYTLNNIKNYVEYYCGATYNVWHIYLLCIH